MQRISLPDRSKYLGCSQDTFSAHTSFVNVGKNSKASKNGASCSTTRWIVMTPSLSPRVIAEVSLADMLISARATNDHGAHPVLPHPGTPHHRDISPNRHRRAIFRTLRFERRSHQRQGVGARPAR